MQPGWELVQWSDGDAQLDPLYSGVVASCLGVAWPVRGISWGQRQHRWISCRALHPGRGRVLRGLRAAENAEDRRTLLYSCLFFLSVLLPVSCKPRIMNTYQTLDVIGIADRHHQALLAVSVGAHHRSPALVIKTKRAWNRPTTHPAK